MSMPSARAFASSFSTFCSTWASTFLNSETASCFEASATAFGSFLTALLVFVSTQKSELSTSPSCSAFISACLILSYSSPLVMCFCSSLMESSYLLTDIISSFLASPCCELARPLIPVSIFLWFSRAVLALAICDSIFWMEALSFERSCSFSEDSFLSSLSVCTFSSVTGGLLLSSWSSSTSMNSFSNSEEVSDFVAFGFA